jgi:hypothetical protein
MLRIEEKSLARLEEISAALKQRGVLVVGSS